MEIEFRDVPFGNLERAGSLTDPVVVGDWLRRIQSGRPVPPPVVLATDRGTYYLRDGNHRYEAMRQLLGNKEAATVRVAVVVPRPGFQFRYRRFRSYGTYVLEPAASAPQAPRTAPGTSTDGEQFESQLAGRTMILVAHPDDETGGCAGLLQRLHEPVVVFATDGAPADEFFWKSYGSRQGYRRVRRKEAVAALAKAGVANVHFLSDCAGREMLDQELYREIPRAVTATRELVRRYEPDTIVVPAYEGGHPDHDACSFVGYLLGRQVGVPVWEMPLYHRCATGELVCRRFREVNGAEVMLVLTPSERAVRYAMMATYASQPDLQAFVSSPVEYFRPQADYDYTQPPHSGTLNYEAWHWPISSAAVCREFGSCLAQCAEFANHGSSSVETGAVTMQLL